MDKVKAIKLLKRASISIIMLDEKSFESREFQLWFDKVKNIISNGLDKEDLETFYSTNLQVPVSDFMTSPEIKRDYYRKRLSEYDVNIEKIIQKYEILGIEEKPATITITPPKSPAEVAIQLFNGMKLHPDIVTASKSLFETQHYAPAIFEAFKAVENFVKQKAGLSLYGKQLMAKVFDEENPLIKVTEGGKFNKEVQEGFKFLFMGATLGIRNPKAHQKVIQRDPFITLEYLAFASFLIKRIEGWEGNLNQ